MESLSVVIPTYNRAEMLRSALTCLIGQETGHEFIYEVVVVDDGSEDHTRQVVGEFSRRAPVPVRYVLGEGKGYTHALNTGVTKARGDYLVFFDDDQLTHPRWLQALYTVAVQEEASIVGGPISLKIPEEVYRQLGPVYRDMCGESHDFIFPEKYRNRRPLPAGGNRLVSRVVFATIGTFDEEMLTGGCDRDFLLRALAAGFRPAWAPGATIKHVIEVDRLTPERIKWYSLQWGCSFAFIDRKRWGMGKTALAGLARLSQALLIHLPCLLGCFLVGNKAGMRDRQALWWRNIGYGRKTLQLLAPNLFVQRAFFARVEFRRVHGLTEEKILAGAAPGKKASYPEENNSPDTG